MANKHIGEVMNLGWFIAVAVCGLTYLGHMLDNKLELFKFPLFTVLGALGSFVIIGIKLYVLVKKLNDDE
ncbi:MAG: hypothetical protein OCD01_19810 [Fibrobacterales bacterium]